MRLEGLGKLPEIGIGEPSASLHVADIAQLQPSAGLGDRVLSDRMRPPGFDPLARDDPSSIDPSTAAGERIAALRQAASLSQAELADRAGVSISTVYRAERGDQSLGPRMVARIAAALAVDPSEIHAGEVLLRAELPLTAHRAEEQHEELLLGMETRHGEVMRGLERIESAIGRRAG